MGCGLLVGERVSLMGPVGMRLEFLRQCSAVQDWVAVARKEDHIDDKGDADAKKMS